MTKARKKLAEIEKKLDEIAAAEVSLNDERRAVINEAEELRDLWSRAIGDGSLNLDGTPPPGANEAVRDLSAEFAAAKSKAESDSFSVRADGLRHRRQALESERQRVAVEHFDELSAELIDEAASVRADLDDAVKVVVAVAQRWHSLGQAWLALERAADMGRNHATRLDIPKFPLDVIGDANVMPIPPTLTGADPTIRSAA